MTDEAHTGARVALVTGCGKDRGIGGAIARELARRGAVVVASDVEPQGARNANEDPSDSGPGWEGLATLVEEIRQQGGTASSVTGDVGDEADGRRMVDEVVGRHGRLDILVNNASAPQGGEYAEIEDVPAAAFDDLMAVNLRGTFLMTRAAVPHMRRAGWGRIVNLSSITAHRALRRQAVYASSKAAIAAFTRTVALDLAADGITANAVCPGYTFTSRSFSSARRSAPDMDADAVREELASRARRIPVGRLGTPEDVAGLVGFLASDQSAFITGQCHLVDGGQSIAT